MIRGAGPIRLDNDQRYWRRLARRRVRKARLGRGLPRLVQRTLISLLIGLVLLFAAVRIYRTIPETRQFALRTIEVQGTHRVSAEAVRGRLMHHLGGRNLLDLELGEVAAETARDPWVRSASVKRILPDTLRVTVTERRPCAVATIRGLAQLVDTTGHVIGAAATTWRDDLPVLTGLEGLEGERLAGALARGVRAIERLRRADPRWLDLISDLDLSLDDRIAVRTIEPGPRVLLDPERVERNIPRYLELRREIERQVGPAQYVDLRWRDRIAVLPAVNTVSNEGR